MTVTSIPTREYVSEEILLPFDVFYDVLETRYVEGPSLKLRDNMTSQRGF